MKFFSYLKENLRKVSAKKNSGQLLRVRQQSMGIYISKGTYFTLSDSKTFVRNHFYEETTKRVMPIT